MEAPNQQELEAIRQLRENLSDLKLSEGENEDKYLVKWIRARNLNVSASENMFRKHLAWRTEVEVDTVLDWQAPEGLKADNPWSVCGFDKQGCPVAIIPLGRWNIVKIMNEGRKAEWLRMSLQYFEQMWGLMKQQSKEKKYYVQGTIIVDMEGLSWRQLASRDTVDGVVTMVKYFEANYPEVANKAFIVNAPRIFSLAWNLVKTIVSERTGAKLEFFGSDRTKWRDSMLKVIDEDQLTEYYCGILPNSTDLVDHSNRKLPHLNHNGNEESDEFCEASDM